MNKKAVINHAKKKNEKESLPFYTHLSIFFFYMYQHNGKNSSLLFTYVKTFLDYHKFN